MCSEKKYLNSDFFKSAQKIATQACGVSHMTVRRIFVEANKSTDDSDEEVQFKSPRKLYKHLKKCSELDDFDADVIIHKFYERNEYPTAFSILNEIKKKITTLSMMRPVGKKFVKKLKI
ncbi:Hypothetical protein CINCED_3A019812 [Cinara cedri]|uniref:Uncharacterized protein n=1 Tax=Cinara cedri TaxID=506608 RepID=A0A5E4MVY0_9HEMI|nr:Hypothetical protein CINCED_3A019812 [Cinara cedri]